MTTILDQQNADGSWGREYSPLTTSLVLLAVLHCADWPQLAERERQRFGKAVAYLSSKVDTDDCGPANSLFAPTRFVLFSLIRAYGTTHWDVPISKHAVQRVRALAAEKIEKETLLNLCLDIDTLYAAKGLDLEADRLTAQIKKRFAEVERRYDSRLGVYKGFPGSNRRDDVLLVSAAAYALSVCRRLDKNVGQTNHGIAYLRRLVAGDYDIADEKWPVLVRFFSVRAAERNGDYDLSYVLRERFRPAWGFGGLSMGDPFPRDLAKNERTIFGKDTAMCSAMLVILSQPPASRVVGESPENGERIVE